jgi:hypothetical protein
VSQTQQTAMPAATPPQQVTPAAQPAGQLVSSAALGTPTSDTVRRLNLHTVVTMVACVVFGLVGALAFVDQSVSANRAEDSAAQLIRVQEIQTSLLSADATATNAFLVGGLEPTEQRATYDAAIDATGELIAQAAEAEPADKEALSRLNQLVVGYAATVEQARANNRQGFPVGAQYLRNASGELRASALPILDNLVDANAQRASDEMDSLAVYWFGLVGLAVLVVLLYSQRWIGRRFKRRFNTGLVAATVVVGLCLVVGVFSLARTASQINDIEDGSYAAVKALAQARIAGYDAKSNESLTLIARGSGSLFEDSWQTSAGEVEASLADATDRTDSVRSDLRQTWDAYAGVHQQIRELDDGGDWDGAVAIATGTDAETSSNGTFAAFDEASSSSLDEVSEQTSSGLADVGSGLVLGAVLLLLAGLVAALLARWGIGQRLKEYR